MEAFLAKPLYLESSLKILTLNIMCLLCREVSDWISWFHEIMLKGLGFVNEVNVKVIWMTTWTTLRWKMTDFVLEKFRIYTIFIDHVAGR